MSNIENRRTCVVCGKKYKACRSCQDGLKNGAYFWKASCDTRECFSVMMILNGYFYKEHTKEDAKELLELYLTEDMKPYTDNTRNLIEEIFADEKSTVDVCDTDAGSVELTINPTCPTEIYENFDNNCEVKETINSKE